MAIKSTNVRLKILRGAARVAPRWVAELALRRFATPPKPSRGLGFSVPHEGFELRVRQGRVRGWAFGTAGDTGARGTVALVHGWGGSAPQLGAFIGPLVRAGFRVLAFDAPAHGASSGKRSSLPLFVESLEALALEFGAPAAVVAHSFGCAASAVAMARGLEVERAVFIAPFVDPRARFQRFAETLELDLDVVIELAERRYRARWAELAIVEQARHRGQPLLVVHDRTDRAIALHEAERIAGAWPGAELRVTDGLGHMQILSDPGVVAQAVDFLRKDAPVLQPSTHA